MTMIQFNVGETVREGYLAVPPSGRGAGVLFLHAWWGLTDTFKHLCDKLAAEGFVTFAPDLHHGRVATTISEATHLIETQDFPAVKATAEAAMHLLQSHAAVTSDKLKAIGFSMGAGYALVLDGSHPEAFDKIVLFYGGSEGDLSASKAQFQGHFGTNDEWEPLKYVEKMAAPHVELHLYPEVQHWFLEENQVGYYDVHAAELAWERTINFLKGRTN